MKKYYEVLGLTEDATLEDVNNAFSKISLQLYKARVDGQISRADYKKRYDEIEEAHNSIIEAAKAKAAEEAAERVVTPKGKDEGSDKSDESEKTEEEKKTEEQTGAVVVKQKNGTGWKVLSGVLAIALVATMLSCGLKGCSKDDKSTGAYITGQPAVTETLDEGKDNTTEVTPQETPAADETKADETQVEETQEDYSNTQYVVNLGDVEDDKVVRARAQELVDQMNAAGVQHIVNESTTVPWTVDEIFTLIKYANGVYTPETMEEIDVLHLDLLNLLISPLNTDDYLYHVVFASGNDDFNSLLNSNPNHIGFGSAFAAYGENGVYPLVQWFEQKRFEIYSSTNREEVNAIYREVGQVMADLMKGNGCTITLYDGKDAKEGIEYHFTSEQVLANHSSAMIITTEFQLIMANHYEIRNELGEVVDEVPQTWEVYNKFNSDGVDENGQPIINPDIVTYDEMNAWVNNGCDYEWAIDSVLINGQTFGQRIQGDMEGMAQNNYAMTHDGSLKK